jgi:hypothetical protein
MWIEHGRTDAQSKLLNTNTMRTFIGKTMTTVGRITYSKPINEL